MKRYLLPLCILVLIGVSALSMQSCRDKLPVEPDTTSNNTGFGPSGTPYELIAIHFNDALNGYACGFNGTIIHTTDGGVTWATQSINTTENLYDISFSGPDHGIVVGNNNLIMMTNDGGATWNSVVTPAINTPNGNLQLRGAKFLDASHAIAVGGASDVDGGALVTSDGGAHWTRLTMPDGSIDYGYSLYRVAGTSASNFIIVGNHGTILKTVDGGLTWTFPFTGISAVLLDISMADAMNGFIVGSGGTSMFTTDGGDSWKNTTRGDITADIRGVSSVSATEAWATGEHGMILHTTSQGVIWSMANVGKDVKMTGVAVRDANHIAFVGDAGTMYWKY